MLRRILCATVRRGFAPNFKRHCLSRIARGGIISRRGLRVTVQASDDKVDHDPVEQHHARANDGHMQLSFVDDTRLVVRSDTGIDHLGVKRLGVMLRFQLQGVLFDALSAEVIAQATYANHKCVVVNVFGRRDRSPLLI